MKFAIFIFTFLFLCSADTFTPASRERLNIISENNLVTAEQFELFKSQIDFRRNVKIETRIDSMEYWDLDIIYVEELYFPKKDSFLIREYYFSSEKEQKLKMESKNGKPIFYPADRYYENGKLKTKYFFNHKKSKEHLTSIQNHLSKKKTIDKIEPLIKKTVAHAGCGFSARQVSSTRDQLEKKYKNPRTPKYFLIESLTDENTFTISFQIPVKVKHTVIVEGYSF